MFKKGESGNPGGLKKGTRQKATLIKEKFFQAFDKSGGMSGLVKWLNGDERNRGEFYKMVIQLLPKDSIVRGEDENGNTVPLVLYLPEVKQDGA